MNRPRKSWIVVAGPTASGKSALGMEVARHLQGEIVSCDSVQVYRGFDIGSAKPSAAEMAEIPHHMIDVVTWRDEFDTGKYGALARVALDDIRRRGRIPVVVGGSGLYLRALFGHKWHGELPKDDVLRLRLESRDIEDLYRELEALDPARAAEIHPNDRFRVIRAVELVTLLGHPLRELERNDDAMAGDAYVVVLDPDRAGLHAVIQERTAAMVANGLLEETQRLRDDGCPVAAKPMQSIGYRQAATFLAERNSIADPMACSRVTELINAATRQYAKRQTTWFKAVGADERLTGQPGSFIGAEFPALLARIKASLE